MTPDQFLTATTSLDWSTLAEIQAHGTALALWDEAHQDPRVQLLLLEELLMLVDGNGSPCFHVARHHDGHNVYKQKDASNPDDEHAVLLYYATQWHKANAMVQVIESLEGRHN